MVPTETIHERKQYFTPLNKIMVVQRYRNVEMLIDNKLISKTTAGYRHFKPLNKCGFLGSALGLGLGSGLRLALK